MPTFRHSGDLGDIIYAMPAIKALGGGVLYLDVTGRYTDDPKFPTKVAGTNKFNRTGYDTIRPLLVQQPYIDDVRIWNGESVDYDLNQFRPLINTFENRNVNLAVAHLRTFGLDESLHLDPWLTIKSPPIKLERPFLIGRSVRYHSKYHWWVIFLPQFIDHSIFVGLPKEHEIFEYTFNVKLPFHPTTDALEIAQVLLGAERFIGNQSFIMSIAAGLGVPFLQEMYDYAPNCHFERGNAQYM